MPRFKVVITDFDYGDIDIERAILEPIGAEVVALQAKSEDDLLPRRRDCDAIMNQYARVGARDDRARCGAAGSSPATASASTSSTSRRRRRKASSSPTSATTAPRRSRTTPSRSGWRSPASSSSTIARPIDGVWRWQSGAAHPSPARPHHGHRLLRQDRPGDRRARPRLRRRPPRLRPLSRRRQSSRRMALERSARTSFSPGPTIVMMQVPMTPETRHFLGAARIRADEAGRLRRQHGARADHRQSRPSTRRSSSGRIAGAGLDDPEEEPAKRAAWDPQRQPALLPPERHRHAARRLLLRGVDPPRARDRRLARSAACSRGERPHNPVNNVKLASGAMSLAAA